MHMLRKLLTELRAMIDCACWGRPLGSTRLWEQHLQSIDRILSIANTIEIREVGYGCITFDFSHGGLYICISSSFCFFLQPHDDMYPKLQNLPEECVREILLRLADHKDLESGSKAYSVMQSLSSEQRIWRELCSFHFTDIQINCILEKIQAQDKQLQEKQQQHLALRARENQNEPTISNPDGTLLKIESRECTDWKKVYHKLRK